MMSGRRTGSEGKIVYRLGSKGSRFLVGNGNETFVIDIGKCGNRDSLSGTGWRRSSQECGSTESEVDAALVGVIMGTLAGGTEVVILEAVVVGGAWRRTDLRGGRVWFG